jgi:hypothetical protein
VVQVVVGEGRQLAHLLGGGVGRHGKVDGVLRSLDWPNGYQIYNLGNGNPIELGRFISLVEQSCGKQAVIEVSHSH